MNSQSLARGLAFFSFGLGITQLLAPRQLARAIGVSEDNENLMRFLGLREISAGLGIMQGNSGMFLWSRVGGDVMDLGLLAGALRKSATNRNRVIGAMAAVAGVTALDVAAAMLESRNPADESWRIARGDRSGLALGDPMDMRRRSEETMAEHQSGHLHGHRPHRSGLFANEDTRSLHEAAIGQFEEGD